MKIRNWIIMVTIGLGMVYAASVFLLLPMQTKQTDVTKVNDIVQSLEEEFSEKQTEIVRTGNKDQMNYQVVLLWDEDYDFWINQAIQSQETIVDLWNGNQIAGKIILFKNQKELEKEKKGWIIAVSAITGVSWLIACSAMMVVQIRIIKPFHTMQAFAQRVAQGDLDFKLAIHKGNYFGAFTAQSQILWDKGFLT